MDGSRSQRGLFRISQIRSGGYVQRGIKLLGDGHMKRIKTIAFILCTAIMLSAFSGVMAAPGGDVRMVCHRGLHSNAPENTLPAFEQAADVGYKYVESDVQFTRDGVAVLCHDSTINRTARNADGSFITVLKFIRDMTFEDLNRYDFGIACGKEYAGTKIPTFSQWLELCNGRGLTPYIEIKQSMTAEQVTELVNMVSDAGMSGKVVWLAFTWYADSLKTISAADPKAELGILTYAEDISAVSLGKTLKTGQNKVFLDVLFCAVSKLSIQRAQRAGLETEIWTLDDANIADAAVWAGASGVTTNKLLPGSVDGQISAIRALRILHNAARDTNTALYSNEA
jgi:glycerophosphoryl diester phosphodiesterase